MAVTSDEIILQDEVERLVKKGWALDTVTATSASLSRKKFSLLWFIVTFGTYLFWFIFEKPQRIYLRVKNGKLKKTRKG